MRSFSSHTDFSPQFSFAAPDWHYTSSLAALDNSRELFWLSVSQFSPVEILAEFGGERVVLESRHTVKMSKTVSNKPLQNTLH